MEYVSENILAQAYTEARANLNKDSTFRRWGSKHGGVYVPVTENQKSVPWLSHLPGRDVTTTEGQKLTLLNPASMLRQMMDSYAEEYGVRGRITGLKYLNPGNKPDNWETTQLESFTRGDKKEVWEISELNGKPHLRYLRAMYMGPSCIKCHGVLGYELGDMRGATGISLPLDAYYEKIEQTHGNLELTYGVIWFVGLIGIAAGGVGRLKRKTEKQRYRFLINRIPVGVYLFVSSPDGSVRFEYVNSKFCEIFGLKEDDFLRDPSLAFSSTHPDDYDSLIAANQHAIETGEIFFWEGRFVINGQCKWIEVNSEPSTLPNGDILWSGLMKDVSERKHAEVENMRMQHELQQAQKMESLGHLTGGIAHDFNNMLGIITGYAELVDHGLKNQTYKKLDKYVQNIINAGQKATKLVSQMLAFSRNENTEDVVVQLESLVIDEFNMLCSTLPSTIEIKKYLEADLPSVLMNSTQFHQIIMNLAINARDAMEGEGELTIRLGWVRDINMHSTVSHKPIRGDWIELSISDTGSGVDEDITENIFNPFFTTKEVGKGTGMGLAVIYRIMENHGGHILLESELGKGSTFHMLFPPILDMDANQSELIQKAVEIPLGDGSEIMVVDDEPMLSTQIQETVTLQGYQATSINSSVEALEIFKKNPDRFSMLITDQTMPKMTGVELIEKVREIRPELPVIMCSGYSNKIDATKAAELGIFYFDKPVNRDKLLIKVTELLSLQD